MLKSNADQLFWMSRYLERVDNTVSILNAYLDYYLLSNTIYSEKYEQFYRLLFIFDLDNLYSKLSSIHNPSSLLWNKLNIEPIILYMMHHTDNVSSLYYSLYQARENARSVRNMLSVQLWEAINITWLDFQTRIQDNSWNLDKFSELFQWIKYRIYLIDGIMNNTMLRDESYELVAIGQSLERADFIVRLLKINILSLQERTNFIDINQLQYQSSNNILKNFYPWNLILHSASVYEIYYKIYQNIRTPIKIIELLILQKNTNRSLLGCINRISTYIHSIINGDTDPILYQVEQLQSELSTIKIDYVFQKDLSNYLNQYTLQIQSIAQAINKKFLI